MVLLVIYIATSKKKEKEKMECGSRSLEGLSVLGYYSGGIYIGGSVKEDPLLM